jgi:hypothetical protein
MFWITLLAIFGSVAVRVNRERHRELIPYVVAVIAVVQMFFLYLTIIHNNPFSTFLTETHADGQGLNPLLQNFYMVIHPPTLYLGFVGLTIPYAFGMAALITGYLDDSWLRAVRRWTMVSWLFLSVGLGLGMIWAYEELGWGGYWMWDPVENAGALPWFTATAFLHSVMVQERRGMLRIWNVTLVILTFFLTIFGTFMTRSGIVQSVHAFGEDPELTRLFTIFMAVILTVSFAFVIYRLPLLRARNELDSVLSREAAFLVNNWIHRRAAILQQVHAADRAGAARAHRRRPAARVAQVRAGQPAGAVPLARALRRRGRHRDGGARCSRLDLGHLLGVVRLRHSHGRAGVLAGRSSAPGEYRHRRADRADRPGGPEQTALRRVRGPRRNRSDLPRVRW